jgi:hypothetical protein
MPQKNNRQKTIKKSEKMSEKARLDNLAYANGMIAEISRAEENGFLSKTGADELLKTYYAMNEKYSH